MAQFFQFTRGLSPLAGAAMALRLRGRQAVRRPAAQPVDPALSLRRE